MVTRSVSDTHFEFLGSVPVELWFGQSKHTDFKYASDRLTISVFRSIANLSPTSLKVSKIDRTVGIHRTDQAPSLKLPCPTGIFENYLETLSGSLGKTSRGGFFIFRDADRNIRFRYDFDFYLTEREALAIEVLLQNDPPVVV